MYHSVVVIEVSTLLNDIQKMANICFIIKTCNFIILIHWNDTIKTYHLGVYYISHPLYVHLMLVHFLEKYYTFQMNLKLTPEKNKKPASVYPHIWETETYNFPINSFPCHLSHITETITCVHLYRWTFFVSFHLFMCQGWGYMNNRSKLYRNHDVG